MVLLDILFPSQTQFSVILVLRGERTRKAQNQRRMESEFNLREIIYKEKIFSQFTTADVFQCNFGEVMGEEATMQWGEVE